MKWLYVIFFTVFFIPLFSFSQDRELFDYVNLYRKSHGLKKVKWDDNLAKISISHTDSMQKNDSIYHSHKNTYENCFITSSLLTNKNRWNEFNRFCKTYFNYEVKIEKDPQKYKIESLFKMYTVFVWHKSKVHRKNMLQRNVKIGACDINFGEEFGYFLLSEFKSNTKLNATTNMHSHYYIKMYATLNLSEDH